MISAIITALVAVGLISSFMLIVNRMLRTDEHWSESSMTAPAAEKSKPQSFALTAKSVHA